MISPLVIFWFALFNTPPYMVLDCELKMNIECDFPDNRDQTK